MSDERFVQVGALPPEIVASMDRSVSDAMQKVTLDPNKTVTIRFEFSISFKPRSGEVVAEFGETVHSHDNQRRTAIVRNNQLQLPGTQQLSEFEPDPEVGAQHIKLRSA